MPEGFSCPTKASQRFCGTWIIKPLHYRKTTQPNSSYDLAKNVGPVSSPGMFEALNPKITPTQFKLQQNLALLLWNQCTLRALILTGNVQST